MAVFLGKGSVGLSRLVVQLKTARQQAGETNSSFDFDWQPSYQFSPLTSASISPKSKELVKAFNEVVRAAGVVAGAKAAADDATARRVMADFEICMLLVYQRMMMKSCCLVWFMMNNSELGVTLETRMSLDDRRGLLLRDR